MTRPMPPRPSAACRTISTGIARCSRTHGLAGTVADGLWTCRGHVPPYYSNAITVSPDGQSRQRRAHRRPALRRSAAPSRSRTPSPPSTLRRSAFAMLFDAEWIWRDPLRAPPADAGSWQRVTTPDGLDAWEAAWARKRLAGGPPASSFPPFLPTRRSRCSHADAGLADRRRLRGQPLARLRRPLQRLLGRCDQGSISPPRPGRWPPGRPDWRSSATRSGRGAGCRAGFGFRSVGPLRIWLAEMPRRRLPPPRF